MESKYYFKEIAKKESEIKERLAKWNDRGIRTAGFESNAISELFSELAELERLSELKIMESEG
ncbi:TPA_asm: hypothetical protein GEQ36_03095 [Listeria monocytogenes]|uniref:hypothetical protein n=1 Tax=Listeria TaxID=1637 RepID=UPI00083D61FF|nr:MULTISPECIES: hypothetical protein [Listeria]EAC2511320.1 hypothetical protein [Listeria monocytogenes]EAD0713063.1 hypothetical protein [Listeria monocytogenes]EAE0837140.1 hypothetical protein [Listeria monocytogenes]EAE0840428.1 hypothetical protein [Listeria monocytogenes]EAE5719794.1 hypothetical protein [Listeria monocytogenes]